jgi:hypothetical protein
MNMWIKSAVLAVGFVFTNTIGCSRSESGESAVRYDVALEPYVEFLENTTQDPVDYVVGLFDQSDIVILCERAHPEYTQYDLIFQIVSDPRFVEEVGYVFTEIGVGTQAGAFHDFVHSGDLEEAEVRERLNDIYRNVSFHPTWSNRNFYDFLDKVRALNSNLSPGGTIEVYPADVTFSWEGMTAEEYKTFQATLRERDRIMADRIIERMNENRAQTDGRKKALVVMNFRHAYNDRFERSNGEKGENVGRYLFEAYPGKVANVLINSLAVQIGTDRRPVLAAIQDGKWDAAFSVAGDPSIGFDFAGSPFGADAFDHFPAAKEGLTYEDVFTGFVFFVGLKDHKYVYGIPGLFDDGFDAIAVERYMITGMKEDAAWQVVEEQKVSTEAHYERFETIEAHIAKWIDGRDSEQ